jgi:ABC-type transport system involved in multi-copper enzyme maturation permease subunit
MKPVVLIAGNFIREQRWPLVLLLVWVLGTGTIAGLTGARVSIDDVLFFLKQQAVYGVVFSAFLAASAVHNERKSRRILAVLSKGISRGQYLAGLLAGVWFGAGLYCAAMAGVGTWIFANARLPKAPLWALMGVLLAACVLTAIVAMFFSTFLSPLFSTAATALSLGVTAVIAQRVGRDWSLVLPVYELLNEVMNFSVHGSWRADWIAVYWAVVETVLLWLLASWIFSRRDIAVAVE